MGGGPEAPSPTPRAPRRHAGGGEADAGLRAGRLHLLRQDGDLAEGGGDVSATQPPQGDGRGSRTPPRRGPRPRPSARSYVLTLITDGMRSVRSFHFDKAAASVLTTCVSPPVRPRGCVRPSRVAGTPQISPLLPADGDAGAGLPLPGVPPGQLAAAQVHGEAAGGARRRGQGRGRQAGGGRGAPRGSRSPRSPRPHRHVPATASPSSWPHCGCTPVAVSWSCRDPTWLGHRVPRVSVSPLRCP